jgi:hypothetical protein
MADYRRKVIKLLSKYDCYFVRHGKGDHDVWYSPITNRNVIVDGTLNKKGTANAILASAGLKERV